tara:strand:+ start:3283 stop:3561 length:279 start_codon:yes stop_codon:yes gene_type:complete
MSKINNIKRDILTRYIETKVLNGEYIKDIIGKPLNYWDYDKILIAFEAYLESDIYQPTEDDKEEMRKDVALLGIIEHTKVARKLNKQLNYLK